MAKYRPIFTKMWDDPDFQKLSPYEKLVFIYLCTNDSTSESGIYPVSLWTIAKDVGIRLSQVKRMIEQTRLKNISYDSSHCIVFLHNFLLYNGKGREESVIKSIYKDYVHNKTPLWDEFAKKYPECVVRIKGLEKERKNPNLNPFPNHNPNLTPNPSNAQNPENPDEITYQKTLAIFAKHWKEKHFGNYMPDPERERPIALELIEECRSEDFDDPFRVFDSRVARLMAEHDIKKYTGLRAFWNAGAEVTPWANT